MCFVFKIKRGLSLLNLLFIFMALTSEKKEKQPIKPSSDKDKKSSDCIACGKKAEFCMRGLPKNCYCKACAEAYFKFLNYLDKL